MLLRSVVHLIRNLLFAPFWPLWATARLFGRPRGRWVVIRLKSRIVEARRPTPWLSRLIGGSLRLPSSLLGVRELVERSIEDPKIEGLAFVLPRCTAGWAICCSVRDEIRRANAAGKQTVVLLSQGGGHREMFVASAAGRVFVAPRAMIHLLGLSAESHYLQPLLERTGLEVEAFARKEFKSAVETLSRDSMSAPQREQLQAILDTQTDTLLRAFSERTGKSAEQCRALFEQGTFDGDAAIQAGLVDGLAYEDELPGLLGCSKDRPLIEGGRYLAHKTGRFFRPLNRRPYLAVVNVKGAISESGSPHGRRSTIVSALRAVRKDRRAKGLLLWVDSPGGSADASDLIHREVVRVKEKKPVVAYFGDVAASGGYYIAAHADAIIAQPLTLTGSIGVVSARLLAQRLLDRVGVRTEVLRTAPHADMYSPHRPLSQEERALIDRELDAFYAAFVELVADGRGRPVQEIEPYARGRVWLGADAHERGLVDGLGGFGEALRVLRERTELPDAAQAKLQPSMVTSYRLDDPPPPAQFGWLRALPAQTLGDLLALAGEGSRVLYHALSLPRVR